MVKWLYSGSYNNYNNIYDTYMLIGEFITRFMSIEEAEDGRNTDWQGLESGTCQLVTWIDDS